MTTPLFRLGQAVELALRADQEPAVGDGGGGEGHLLKRIAPQHLELGPNRDDVGFAVLTQAEELAVVRPRRGGEGARRRVDALAVVVLLARLRVETGQEAAIVEDVEEVPRDNRRRVVGANRSLRPGELPGVA